ncbi:MAG: hypothetical protein GC131_02715 [Alphaproteobacteria bacterium]|nr:hypothetical protein [Alphaproteobacteria bacterium]
MFVESETYEGAIKGSSCILYYKPWIMWKSARFVLIRHADGRYGNPGGLADPEDNNDMRVAAVREMGEEVRDARGKPALPDVNPRQLKLLGESFYKPDNPQYRNVHQHTCVYKLSMREYTRRAKPLTAIDRDTQLRNTKGEISGVEILTAREILRRTKNPALADDPARGLPFTYAASRLPLIAVARKFKRPSPVWHLNRGTLSNNLAI